MLATVSDTGGGTSARACLTEDLVVAFLDGRADADTRAGIEEHVDRCQDCFDWIARMLRQSFLHRSEAIADTVPIADLIDASAVDALTGASAGGTVGRYQVLERLGQGAMGVVYRAYDPVLERAVALKLIRSERPSPDLRRRALQEAQALARLQHPNVVTVHDLGFVGEQVFVAMELLEGETLAAWLRRRRRDWREIRDVYVQAARGLEAAHAAGLVHRDFKPENVLVCSDRVVVTDFGLVCAMSVGDGAATQPAEQAGTPAYMAPEQFEAGAIDARTDVFSFCAALHESLYAQAAFEGYRFEERRSAVLTGRLRKPPSDARVPRWLRRAVLDGLERDPNARPTGMGELIVALERDRRVRRRIAAVAAAMLVVATIATSLALVSYRSPLSACRSRSDGIARRWTPAVKKQIADAFAATHVSFAAQAMKTIEPIVDRYVADWSRAYAATCDATYRDGAQSLEAFDLRVSCLETRRAGLDQLVDILRTADAATVGKAVTAVSDLDPIKSCSDPLLLRGTPPPPPAIRAAVSSLRHALAVARGYELVGRYQDAETRIADALAQARTTGYAALEAEALIRTGFVARYRGRDADAERAFTAAFEAAERGGADYQRAQAAIELVYVVGRRRGKPIEGAHWAEQAEAILIRLGNPSDERAALAMNRGLMRKAEGKLDLAESDLRSAYQLWRDTLPPDNPLVPLALGNLGTVLDERGDYTKAGEIYQSAYAQTSALLGSTHPRALQLQANLAGIAYSLGQFRRAEHEWRQVLDAQVQALGPQHPDVVSTAYNIASAEGNVGDYTNAIAEGERALTNLLATNPDDPLVARIQISLAVYLSARARPVEARQQAMAALARWRKQFGDSSPLVGNAYCQLARLAIDLRHFDEAQKWAERARPLLEADGGNSPRLATALDLLGNIYRERGRAAAAVPLHERALQIRTAANDLAELPNTLTGLGLALAATGNAAEARARLERAQTLRASIDSDPQQAATTAFGLARTLPPSAAARAHTLAMSALDGFTQGGARFDYERNEVRRWLDNH